MSSDTLTKNIAGIQEALCSFLATLLDAEAPLRIDAPEPVDFDEANSHCRANLVFTAGTSPDDRWAVLLDPSWLPLLSRPKLGESLESGEPGADDLSKDLASQAYDAVRTQLAAAGVSLPDITIDLLAQDGVLDGETFSTDLLRTPFVLTIDDQEHSGFALIPAPPASDIAGEGDDAEATDSPHADAPNDKSRHPAVEVAAAAFPELGGEIIGGDGADGGFSLLAEVELEVAVELGRRKIPLADVLRLTTGSVIELDKLVGEPLEVYANGRLIAEGEAVVMDEQFGIRITSLASLRPRAKTLV